MDYRCRRNREKIVEKLKKSNNPDDLKLLEQLQKEWDEKAKTYKKDGRRSNEELLEEEKQKAERKRLEEEHRKQLAMLSVANSLEPKDVELAIRETGGWLSKTASALGITVDALRKIIKQNKHLKAVLYEVREATLDAVEDALYRRIIEKQDTLAAMFWLKCQGQHRGWIDKPQAGSANKPIYIKIMPIGANPKGGRPKKAYGEVKILPGKVDRVQEDLEGKTEFVEGELL